jgi:hypothetical protein
MVTGVEGEKAPALQLETLLALGLDQRTAENALVNSKVTANLAAVIAEVKSFAMVMPFLIRQLLSRVVGGRSVLGLIYLRWYGI